MLNIIFILISFFIFCNQVENSQQELEEQRQKLKQKFYEEVEKQKSDWSVRASIRPDDSVHVIKMTYTDEMGLIAKSIYCMAIFENIKTKEYKLVAPWIDNDYRIQKSNIKEDEIEFISKEHIKKEIMKGD